MSQCNYFGFSSVQGGLQGDHQSTILHILTSNPTGRMHCIGTGAAMSCFHDFPPHGLGYKDTLVKATWEKFQAIDIAQTDQN
ncbi:hypothetical protein RY27_11820 [Litorilinea aerophila]|nr:hypothetical protein RY27_11820 [Litorilinea aerophila]